jgi:predicted metalloprotease
MLLREDELRWLAGDEVRVSGEVVDDEGDTERPERLGEKAVRRRWREPVRMGVKGDWKRLVRVGETILAVDKRLVG